jgi:hypothetical protein
MDVIHITNKRKHMNTVGKFYIYSSANKTNTYAITNLSAISQFLTQYSQSAKTKHTPWRKPTEQATQSSTHTTSLTIIVYE